MKLSELLATLEHIRVTERNALERPVVVAYRDTPENHYVFDNVVITPAPGGTNANLVIVLIAG